MGDWVFEVSGTASKPQEFGWCKTRCSYRSCCAAGDVKICKKTRTACPVHTNTTIRLRPKTMMPLSMPHEHNISLAGMPWS